MEGLAFINLKLNVEKCPSNGNKRFQGGLPQCTISIWFLAAGGPYWVLISQKVGSLFQSLGVLITFGDSEFLVAEGPYFLIIIRLKLRFLLTRLTGF